MIWYHEHLPHTFPFFVKYRNHDQGRIQDFKLGGGGAFKKKWRRAEGDTEIFGVFRVKNHDFTTTNLIFSNFRGGGGAPLPPGSAPDDEHKLNYIK